MTLAPHYQIGQLAAMTGLSVDTLRFYENKGLISAPARSASGYRLYTDDDITTLRFIQRAKQVGFTLNEIQELLVLKLKPENHTCEEVKQHTAAKIQQINNKIAELVQIKQSLNMLHNTCNGGDESATRCTILQSLYSAET